MLARIPRRYLIAVLAFAALLASYAFVVAPTERQQMLCRDALQRRQQVTTMAGQGRHLANFDLNDADNAVYSYCQP